MRVQTRLLTYFFLTQIFVSIITFALIRLLPREGEAEIDRELSALADQMVAEANRLGRIELDEISLPPSLDQYQAGSTFFVVIRQLSDGQTRIVNDSGNLIDVKPLDDSFTTDTIKFSAVQENDQTLRVLTYPLVGQFGSETRLIGYMQIGRLVNDYAYLAQLSTVIIYLAAAALCLGAASIFWLVPTVTKPLTEIIEAAEQITTTDDLSRRIPNTYNNDEISQLAGVLNNLMMRLEALFRTQQRLLADVSHELRTPLTSIRGNVDLIRRMGQPDPESIAAIEQEIERMTRLVNDLLTLARADIGGLPIQREPVDLDMIFMGVFEDAGRLKGSNSSLRVILEDVRQARVLGDADRLKQLILNLVTNAIKYTEPGGRVTLSMTTDETRAIITVSDTGIGIPPEDLRYIFDRFYRVNKGRTRESGGAGLGLAIAQSIAKAHQGEIKVKSKVGEGSTFTLFLPLLQPPEPPKTMATSSRFGGFLSRLDSA